MGNHYAGHAMGRGAEIAMLSNPPHTKEQAITLLEIICRPWEGCDAEFEAEDPNQPGFIHPDYDEYSFPNAPLGELIAMVWGEPGVVYDASDDAWWDVVYDGFKKHFHFC